MQDTGDASRLPPQQLLHLPLLVYVVLAFAMSDAHIGGKR